jgi:hypothetical protein
MTNCVSNVLFTEVIRYEPFTVKYTRFQGLRLCTQWHPMHYFRPGPNGALFPMWCTTRTQWHPIPYVVHYFRPGPNGALFPMWCTTLDQDQMAPYSLCSALVLLRAWSKVVHYIGERVPFEKRPIITPLLKG